MAEPRIESLARADIVRREDDSYRRGVVLGLTMAELVILIIFCLLLALAALLRAREQEIARLAPAAATLHAVEALVVEEGHAAVPAPELPDYFREIIRVAAAAPRLSAQNTALETRLAAMDHMIAAATTVSGQADLDAAIRDLAAVTAAVDAALARRPGPPPSASQKQEFLAALIGAAAASVAAAPPPAEGEPLAELRAQRDRLTDENTALRARLAALRAEDTAGGAGTEHPSCWYEPGTTKPEYLFEVALRDTGLSLDTTALPHRAAERAALPIGGVELRRVLSPVVFLDQTAPLLRWADAHGCRFFVRVTDVTAPTEKLLYKARLRTVEQRFYKFEVIDHESATPAQGTGGR